MSKNDRKSKKPLPVPSSSPLVYRSAAALALGSALACSGSTQPLPPQPAPPQPAYDERQLESEKESAPEPDAGSLTTPPPPPQVAPPPQPPPPPPQVAPPQLPPQPPPQVPPRPEPAPDKGPVED